MSDTNSHTHHSSTSHNSVQKSSTLNRRYVRRPHAYVQSNKAKATSKKAETATQPNESDFISRFIASTHSTPSKKVVQPECDQSTPAPALNTKVTQSHPSSTPVSNKKVVQSTPAEQVPTEPENEFQTAVRSRISAQRYRRVTTRDEAVEQPIEQPAEPCEPPCHRPEMQSQEPCEQPCAKPCDEPAEQQNCSASSVPTQKAPHLTQEKPAVDSQALAKTIHAIAMKDDKKSAKADKKPTGVKHSGNAKRFIIAFSSACACVAALAFFIHLSMPDVSFKVAALQTGIDANYPAYIPRDFHVSTVYTEEEGKTTLEYTGPSDKKYSLSEQKSSWDTEALRKNFVEARWGTDYDTIREQGLTIFVSGSNATWVNGGILYRISSDNNTLTKKQIKNIAVSI